MTLLQATPGATTPPAAQGNGLGTFVIAIILFAILAIVVAVVIVGLRRPSPGAGGRSWLDYGNFFIVAIGIVAVLVAFLVAVLFATDLDLFREPAELLAILTALFGVIGTLVGTYFGVKAGSDAASSATTLATSAIAPTATQPTVTVVSPPAGTSQVPPNTQVAATFSKEMNPATLTTNSFTLATSDEKNRVAGEVRYDATLKQATFSPSAPLVAATAYTATITPDVRDQAGSALSVTVTWEFTVA